MGVVAFFTQFLLKYISMKWSLNNNLQDIPPVGNYFVSETANKFAPLVSVRIFWISYVQIYALRQFCITHVSNYIAYISLHLNLKNDHLLWRNNSHPASWVLLLAPSTRKLFCCHLAPLWRKVVMRAPQITTWIVNRGVN